MPRHEEEKLPRREKTAGELPAENDRGGVEKVRKTLRTPPRGNGCAVEKWKRGVRLSHFTHRSSRRRWKRALDFPTDACDYSRGRCGKGR